VAPFLDIEVEKVEAQGVSACELVHLASEHPALLLEGVSDARQVEGERDLTERTDHEAEPDELIIFGVPVGG